MEGFVGIHTITVISMPYLVNNSKTKTDIKKMKTIFCLESVDQENKQMVKFDDHISNVL